jgi:hypothetical protein
MKQGWFAACFMLVSCSAYSEKGYLYPKRRLTLNGLYTALYIPEGRTLRNILLLEKHQYGASVIIGTLFSK